MKNLNVFILPKISFKSIGGFDVFIKSASEESYKYGGNIRTYMIYIKLANTDSKYNLYIANLGKGFSIPSVKAFVVDMKTKAKIYKGIASVEMRTIIKQYIDLYEEEVKNRRTAATKAAPSLTGSTKPIHEITGTEVASIVSISKEPDEFVISEELAV